MTDEERKEWFIRLQNTLQRHKHSEYCQKGDKDCRMHFPRPISESNTFVFEYQLENKKI